MIEDRGAGLWEWNLNVKVRRIHYANSAARERCRRVTRDGGQGERLNGREM